MFENNFINDNYIHGNDKVGLVLGGAGGYAGWVENTVISENRLEFNDWWETSIGEILIE